MPNTEFARHIETPQSARPAGEHRELADLAMFLLPDGSAFINGEVVTIDGGERLEGAGQFSSLDELSDDEWQAFKLGIAEQRASDR